MTKNQGVCGGTRKHQKIVAGAGLELKLELVFSVEYSFSINSGQLGFLIGTSYRLPFLEGEEQMSWHATGMEGTISPNLT